MYFLKSRFSSLGFYRLLQWQNWDVGFWGGLGGHAPRARPPLYPPLSKAKPKIYLPERQKRCICI